MVKDVAEALIDAGMPALGYEYINLDDCWEATTRAPDGTMRADPKRFPSGTLKELADWVHSKGLKLGMYTSAGNETCSTGGRFDPGHKGVPGSCTANSGSACMPQYELDTATYASWGVDYVKLDYCTPFPNMQDLTDHFAQAMNKTGRPMWLNFHCQGAYQDWCAVDGNSWRIGPDHHDNWDNTAQVIEILATVAQHSRPYRWSDPDFLMTGGAGCDKGIDEVNRCPGMSETEYRTEFSLWCMASAPLLVSTDLRNMTDFMRSVLLHDELIAINQDHLSVAGGRVGGWNCSEGAAMCQLWARPLSDGSIAAALYNAGTKSHHITLPFDVAGFKGKTAKIRDVWARKDLGTFDTSFTAEVESHGTVVVKLTPATA
mmetsp:Transcript_6395/g.15706  ORF Transcript_6395/g.15706 Transcript_6395/m.15706 type:complete len:374 (+) Transcript_6395:67-1188(+)